MTSSRRLRSISSSHPVTSLDGPLRLLQARADFRRELLVALALALADGGWRMPSLELSPPLDFFHGTHRLRFALSRLVLETLDPLSEDRKCFRLINGVLVERTVKDVVPALKTNQDGLRKVLDDLVKQYKTKQDELELWKVRCPLVPP